MYQFILLVHVFAAICIIALVLVQQGKGASLGPAYGAGASQTMFGSRGSGSFLFRVTLTLLFVFFVTSIGLNYMITSYMKQDTTFNVTPKPITNNKPASTQPAMPDIPSR